MVGIRHILATPFHPQSNGKLERYHQTIKGDVNQVPYEAPSDLQEAIAAFVSYYNHRRTTTGGTTCPWAMSDSDLRAEKALQQHPQGALSPLFITIIFSGPILSHFR